MMISLPASVWPYRILNACLMGLLAWCVAGLFWLIVTPGPTLPAPAPERTQVVAARDLSPLARLFQPAVASGAGDQPSTLGLKLHGVIGASQERYAAAIFAQADGKEIAVRVGQEVAPGATLAEVSGNYAIVDNRGRRERIELDVKPAADLTAQVVPDNANLITPAAQIAAQPIGPDNMTGERPAQPLDQRPDARPAHRMHTNPANRNDKDEMEISRSDMLQSLKTQNVAGWQKGLVQTDDGIAIQDIQQQPLADTLHLQTNDVLKSVNGMPLQHVQDISNLYGALTREAPVSLTVLRNGTPITLTYRIKP